MSMRAIIVIPVFDEAPTIGAVVSAARRHASVIVVDDGSRDDSGPIARAAGALVLRHGRRAGKGAALESGLAAARRQQASHVLTLDGDGQHDPRDIPRMLEAARRSSHALVIGSRLASLSEMPAGRAHATRVGTFFLSWATGLPPVDTQSGFRVYPLALCDTVGPRAGGFVWETEILVRAAAAGAEVIEVPVAVIPRAARRSRFRPLVDGAAIASYLARPVVARWGAEVVAAIHEVRLIFDRDRRAARHAEMWTAVVSAPVLLWGLAFARVFVERSGARLLSWWRHPRRRRAAVAAWATLAAPGVLALLAAQSACGDGGPDVAKPLVRRLFDTTRLSPLPPSGPSATAEPGPALPPAVTVSR
jgi:Glycosyl transferase family 2